MKLSRIDYIGLNGGDGEHYMEQLSESEQAYMKWISEGTTFKVTNLDMWNACWKLAQAALIKEKGKP